MITYLLDTLVNSIKTSLINKLGLDPSTEVDLDDFPELIDEIPILDSVEELTVTENGTYTGTDGVTYNPVNVNLPLGSKSVTANGTYNASDDSLKGYSSVTVAIDDTDAYKLVTDTTASAVKTLTTAPLPFNSLKVGIEAVQDLHGYDHPWVGGAGKNKMPSIALSTQTKNGITFTPVYYGDSLVRIDVKGKKTIPESIWYVLSDASITISQNMIMNGTQSGSNVKLVAFRVAMGSGDYIDAGDGVEIPTSAERIVEIDIRVDGNADTQIDTSVYPMLRYATIADDSYAPYSNICPISGWDAVNLGVVDMLGLEIMDSWLTSIGEAHSVDGDTLTINYITLKPFDNPCTLFDDDRSVTISVDSITGVATGVKLQLVDANNTLVGQVTNSSKTFTGVGSKIRIDYGTGGQTIIKGLQIYSNGQTYTENLATTNYGGYWDVTKGEIGTTHHNIASYNGETLPGAWISSMDEYTEGGTPTTGAQVVYELATPTTTSTTPRFIKANDGTTNLWADSGKIEEVGFFEEFNA